MKNINITAMIITVLIIGTVLTIFYIYQSDKGKATISVTGNYQTKVAPDQAVVYLLIQTINSSADQAKNENARISDNVMTALLSIGINTSDIETENYNIYPNYNYSSGSQQITGYTASNNIKITTKAFSNVGRIIDTSVGQGALVSYINFELSTTRNNQYKALAMTNASLDARTKADAIASGLGKTVGRLVSVTTSDFNYLPYPLYASIAGQDLKTVETNIQPQNVDITSTVTVSYEIV